jgi:hypothetical protein
VGASTIETLRLGELLAALSLATDLANGMPLEKGRRTCLLAVSVGRRMGLDDETLSDCFYVNLLRAIGCTAFASEEATAYGDDIAFRNTYFPVDFGQESEIIEATKTNLARDEPPAVSEDAVANPFVRPPPAFRRHVVPVRSTGELREVSAFFCLGRHREKRFAQEPDLEADHLRDVELRLLGGLRRAQTTAGFRLAWRPYLCAAGGRGPKRHHARGKC